jgi:cell surface protein SprA
LIDGCEENNSDTKQRCVSLVPEESTSIVRDYQFERYRFFDIGWFGGQPHLLAGDRIIQFRLFEGQEPTNVNPNLPEGYAYRDILNSIATPDSILLAWRELAAQSEYNIEPSKHFLLLLARRPNIAATAVAYWMVVLRANGTTDTLGDVSINQAYRLQLLKQANPEIDDGLWDACWDNVYDLRTGPLAPGDFEIDVFKGTVGDEGNRENRNLELVSGRPYLQLLGLDSIDSHGLPVPDGKVDIKPLLLDLDLDLLIFPSRHPFALAALADPIPSLYSTTDPISLRDSSQYYIRVSYLMTPDFYSLGEPEIVEGSELVTVNGFRLTRGVQYSIDYTAGQIYFLSGLIDQNSSVDVCFEYVP